MFKFIHTADIHLDSPLRGLSQYEGAPVDLLRNATRLAFSKLIDMALEEEVAFIVIAGDLYDGDWRDFNTGLFFVSEMNRLRRNNIRCFLLYGNHDAESQLTKNLPLPDNVSVFGTRKSQTFNLDDIHVALHGHSFKQRDTVDNLAADYPEPVSDAFNIGVLHTGLGGYAAHAKYAPCTLDQLKFKGYDYWALGHIHKQEVLHENPHIIFSGNLQGRHIREQGAKGAVLVTVGENTITDMEWIYPDCVRWTQLEIDLTTHNSHEEALRISKEAMQKAIDQEADRRTLVIRLILNNISPELCHSIMLGEAYFRAELQSLATGSHGEALWIEKIKFKVFSKTAAQPLKNHQDAVYELQGLLAEAPKDPALIHKINKDLGVLLSRLPLEIRSNSDLEFLLNLKEKKTGKLVEEVTPFLLSFLRELEEG